MHFLKIIPTPFVALACCLVWLGASADTRGQQQPPPASPPRTAAPPAAQDEFVPVSELPPDEQLPAVPLVFIAYAVIWLAVLVYVVTIWRRQAVVQKELDALKRQLRS
jgi:CcmD family protein